MSVTWYPPGFEVDVPNPGYGELDIVAPCCPYQGRPLVVDEWHRTLMGAQLGEFLAAVTERALQPDTAPVGVVLPAFVTPAVARDLLPALQEAVLLAVAGTDRYERIVRDPADQPPEPLCSRCDEGTLWTPGAMANDWCAQYGHQPFGMGADTSWQTAHRLHELHLDRWQARQALEAATVGSRR